MIFIRYSRLAAVMVLSIVVMAGMGFGTVVFAGVAYFLDPRKSQHVPNQPLSAGLVVFLLCLLVLPQLFTLILVRSVWMHWYEWDVFRLGPVSWLFLIGICYALGASLPYLIEAIS